MFNTNGGFNRIMNVNVVCFLLVAVIAPNFAIICSSPWQFSYGNSCYLFSNDSLTWGEARVECFSLGGYLAILDNDSEQKAIISYHNKHFRWLWHWLGGTDFGREGKWFWDHTGKTIANFSYWKSGQPNGKITENCMIGLDYRSQNRWSDTTCDSLLRFLCEKN